LGRVDTGRGNLPTQKLGLVCDLVHTTTMAITDRTTAGVSKTPKQPPNYPGKTQPARRVGVLPQWPSYAHCGPSSLTTGFS